MRSSSDIFSRKMFAAVILCCLAFFTDVLGNCTEGCGEPTLLYESLKCKPIFASAKDCCPTNYDCSQIEQRAVANDKKCYFHGKSYNEGESIDDSEVLGSCRVGCFCESKNTDRMGFTCAVFDCPRPPSKSECHSKYELDKCCSVGEACPPFSATCEVDGKIYHEGERFQPPDSKCTKCVCQSGFKGTFEDPFCKKRECFDEINYQLRVYNFCAPSYIRLDDCCPFNWICPADDDIIHVNKSAGDPNDSLKCKFGKNTLNIGDKFERTDKSTGGKLSCECRIPPFLTCIQNYQYSTYSGEY